MNLYVSRFSGEGAELEWVVSARMALAGMDFSLPGHFGIGAAARLGGNGDLRASWCRWLRGDWPSIRRAMGAGYLAAEARSIDAILEAERRLITQLEPVEAEISLWMGLTTAILERLEGVKHERFAGRLRSRVMAGECGAPCVAFAVKAATFNLGLTAMLSAWLYYEWRTGLHEAIRAADGMERVPSTHDLDTFLNDPEHVAALSGPPADTEQGPSPGSFQVVSYDRR